MTAFGMLAVTAVLMFGVRDSGFVISVFANGVAQIPCEVKPNETLFYVEINMLAELKPSKAISQSRQLWHRRHTYWYQRVDLLAALLL